MRRSDTIPRVILRLLRSGLRRVFNLSFLAALSLLLGIGLGCLWVRTMSACDAIQYVRASRQQVYLGTYPHKLELFLRTSWGDAVVGSIGWCYESVHWDMETMGSYLTSLSKESWLGFSVRSLHPSGRTGGWDLIRIIIPLWFPMALSLVLPLCWLRRWRRQARRKRMGLCFHCGYDIRATPDATGPRLPRCPECGRESQLPTP